MRLFSIAQYCQSHRCSRVSTNVETIVAAIAVVLDRSNCTKGRALHVARMVAVAVLCSFKCCFRVLPSMTLIHAPNHVVKLAGI